VIHTHTNGVLLGKKEQNHVTFRKIDEAGDDHIKQNKPNSER
jgi:hypothetical protein